MYPSIYNSPTDLSIHRIHKSFHHSPHLYILPSIHLLFHPCLSIHLSTIHPSTRPSFHLSVYPSITYLSSNLSICLSSLHTSPCPLPFLGNLNIRGLPHIIVATRTWERIERRQLFFLKRQRRLGECVGLNGPSACVGFAIRTRCKADTSMRVERRIKLRSP